MNITNSNDITFLDVEGLFDISGSVPTITITNLSQGPNLQNVIYAFVVNSPSQTPIHQGSLLNPDITGIWTSTILTDPWPRPFGQIEWSGLPYTFAVFAQDSAGNQYQVDKIVVIRRPPGNTNLSKDMNGVASVDLKVECDQAGIFIQNKTNSSYQGNAGTVVSSVIRVIYPLDQTDTLPPPFVANNFSQALVPITYSSTNYQFSFNTVYVYDQGNGVSVQIRYRLVQRFSVLCDIDLCPLACEFHKMVQSLEDGTCANAAQTRDQIVRITPLMNLVFIGIKEPLCGIDVPDLIERIKLIGCFTCDCCNTGTGVIPQTASVIDGFTYQVVPICGDITGNVTQAGNLIQINLKDVSYIFQMNTSPDPVTEAFTVSLATNGTNCTKTYTLNVNAEALAQGILETIGGNAYLINLLNSLVSGGAGQFISVNGSCVFATATATDYIFTLVNIPASGSLAQLNSITVNNKPTTISYGFNKTNLGGLQTYLNSLGLGTFTVGTSGTAVTITTDSNPNNLTNLLYSTGAGQVAAGFSSDPAGFVPVSVDFAVQSLINYICALEDSQSVTSQPYSFPTFNNGAIVSTALPAGSTQAAFNAAVISSLDSISSEVETGDVGGVTCTSLKAVFTPSATNPAAGDLIYMNINGSCFSMTVLGLLKAMISLGVADPTTSAAFCAWVSQCSLGQTCAPFTLFQIQTNPHNTTCTAIVGIEGAFS